MTVGIYVGNGKVALAMADSRVTMGPRQTDTAQKLTTYYGTNIHGVLFGAGRADILSAANNCLQANATSAESVSGLAECIRANWHGSQERIVTSYCDNERRNIEARAHAFGGDEASRKDFILGETRKLIEAVHQSDHDSQSDLILVGYDKSLKGVRAQGIRKNHIEQIEDLTYVIGSGTDGAHLFLTMERQGLDMSRFTEQELLLMISKGYAGANLNQGVGGQASLARINETGVEMMTDTKTILVQNIGAVYSAGLFPYSMARFAMGTILRKDADLELLVKQVAEQTSIDAQLLKTIGLDARELLTLANRKRHQITA